MEKLPKIPGLSFDNQLKEHYGFPHSLDFVNGIRLATPSLKSTGDGPVADDSVAFVSENDTTLHDPILTYGRLRHLRIEPFRPHYVHYDKCVLTFHGFFRQSVIESATEQQRIRYVNVMYFMEDDTITVMEPTIANCGYPQGRIVRRSRIPKNDKGDCITWKDLNIGIDLKVFGITYHLTDCDKSTKEFMRSQGIILNEVEERPMIPELRRRPATATPTLRITPCATVDVSKIQRSMQFSGKVLTFNCETDEPKGMTYKIYYFLEDDTIAIKELKENREGRDYFPLFLKRTKVRKNDETISNMSLLSHTEFNKTPNMDFYGPNDFKVGESVFIFGRRFLLTDCDLSTRKYYSEILKNPQPEKMVFKRDIRPHSHTAIPEYLGFGTPEDSLASYLNLVPKPPRKDIVKYLLYANKYLRFGCELQNATTEDKQRKFILKYSLADGTISIFEPPIRNSGIVGGRFLSPQLIIKPGSNRDEPEYYTSKDFHIGAVLSIHNHEFRLTSADLSVYQNMEEHPELFSENAVHGVREYLQKEQRLNPDLRAKLLSDSREFEANQPAQQEQHRNEIDDMNNCLENVHLYENHEEIPNELKEAEAMHNYEIERYPKNIMPYHDRGDVGSSKRCRSADKKSVSFDDVNAESYD